MHPLFIILADGADVTAQFADRLLALTITDQAGLSSDTASLTIDDRDYRVALPEKGVELEISLGFAQTGLTQMGTYIVDEIHGKGPVAEMRIAAKAIDMASDIRSPRTRSWEDTTFGDVASEVASGIGYSLSMEPGLAAISIPYVAQTSESDLNLISRLASTYGATAKFGGRNLVIVPRSAGVDASGQPIEPVGLGPDQMEAWDWQATSRTHAGTVVAFWSDPDTATRHRVEVGGEAPSQELRHTFGSEDEARRAAEAALDKGAKASGTLSVQLSGFAPDLFAEGLVNISGIKPELTGEWSINSVTHTLDGQGLRTEFKAERDNDAAQP